MTNFFFQNRVARSTGGVTWRYRGVFPIRFDRWKAQGVYFLNIHGRARPLMVLWACILQQQAKETNFANVKSEI